MELRRAASVQERMKLRLIFAALVFLSGALVGALGMWLAIPISDYREVIGSIQFLLRANEAVNVQAAFDQCVPVGEPTYLSHSQLNDLHRALQEAVTKHVE